MATKKTNAELGVKAKIVFGAAERSQTRKIEQAIASAAKAGFDSAFKQSATQFANEIDKIKRKTDADAAKATRAAAAPKAARVRSAPGVAHQQALERIDARKNASLNVLQARVAGTSDTLRAKVAARQQMAATRSNSPESIKATGEARAEVAAKKAEVVEERRKARRVETDERNERAQRKRLDAADDKAAARDAAKVTAAKRKLAQLEGRSDPDAQRRDPNARLLAGAIPNFHQRMQRGNRLNALFPGSLSMQRALGFGPTGLGMLRGGMAMGPALAGVASGSMLGGMAGGFGSGMMGAGLLGLSGPVGIAIASAIAPLTGVVAMIVGQVRGGMARADNAAEGYSSFAASMAPQLGLSPGDQPARAVMRKMYESQIRGPAVRAMGLSPQQALSMTGTALAARGGWAGDAMTLNAQMSALRMNQSHIGMTPELVGRLQHSGRMGGVMGGEVGLPERLGLGAINAGFQGADIGRFAGQFAGMTDAARSNGAFINDTRFMDSVQHLSGMVGSEQAGRLSFGANNAFQSIATRGMSGAQSPEAALMLMTLASGKGVPRTFKELRAAQQTMSQGPTPELWENIRKLEAKNPGNYDVKAAHAGSILQMMGIDATPDLIDSVLQGRAKGPEFARLVAESSQGPAAASSLLSRGGFSSRATDLAQPETVTGAGLAEGELRAGELALSGVQALDKQLNTTAQLVSVFGGEINKAKAHVGDLINLLLALKLVQVENATRNFNSLWPTTP